MVSIWVWLVFSQFLKAEELKLTTYYPAPYGVYKSLDLRGDASDPGYSGLRFFNRANVQRYQFSLDAASRLRLDFLGAVPPEPLISFNRTLDPSRNIQQNQMFFGMANSAYPADPVLIELPHSQALRFGHGHISSTDWAGLHWAHWGLNLWFDGRDQGWHVLPGETHPSPLLQMIDTGNTTLWLAKDPTLVNRPPDDVLRNTAGWWTYMNAYIGGLAGQDPYNGVNFGGYSDHQMYNNPRFFRVPDFYMKVYGRLCVDDPLTSSRCPSTLAAGNLAVDGTASFNSFDLAESFPARGKLVAGDVVSFEGKGQELVGKSRFAYDPLLAGVVSAKPGLLAGWPKPDTVAVALLGRLSVCVNLEGGEIRVGDYLTSSSEPGCAMKAARPGATIGIALEPFDRREKGSILVFVSVAERGAAEAIRKLEAQVQELQLRLRQIK
ncbi:MAG: hypothetical protein HY402_05575 [Elusimicrobia bacterium]|nr:hypothetical protein [Elusimicrobiota bacterium]